MLSKAEFMKSDLAHQELEDADLKDTQEASKHEIDEDMDETEESHPTSASFAMTDEDRKAQGTYWGDKAYQLRGETRDYERVMKEPHESREAAFNRLVKLMT